MFFNIVTASLKIMKRLSTSKALNKLEKLKINYRELVKKNFEHKAKNCSTCEVKGICCTDEHFVNVHITKLEAIAIVNILKKLTKQKQIEVFNRLDKTIESNFPGEQYNFEQKFSCPLFEKETGCLVHEKGKPIPCIQHACYEKEKDLPPDKLQFQQEKAIERINTQTFGNAWNWLPLPVWIKKINSIQKNEMK